MKPACKPGSVVDSHSSGTPVTGRLERPTREQRGPRQCSPIWSCSGWGLPCHRCYQRRGALLPHLFTLTGAKARRRYLFCGTFRGLAPPRRYLAPCPVEPGLSSVTCGHSGCPAGFGVNYTLNLQFDPTHRSPGALIAGVARYSGRASDSAHYRASGKADKALF